MRNLSAFPITPDSIEGEGMTLRDYFAGQALAGWLASYGGRSVSLCDLNHDVIANGVYMMADAMLKAREVQP